MLDWVPFFMRQIILFTLIAATGNAIYHIGQKTLPQTANPMLMLMAVYTIAFLLTAVAAPLFQSTMETSLREQIINWPIFALGLGAFLIEFGFLFLYRSGGSLQWSSIIVNSTTALMLIPIAILVYRESFSITRLLGIVLTFAGLSLLIRN